MAEVRQRSSARPDLTRSMVVTVIGTAFPPLAALATAPILARGLGVDARGEVAAAQAIALLAVSITAFGLPEALTHFVARGSGIRRSASRGVIAITVVAGLAAWLATAAASNWLGGGDPATASLLRLAAASVLPALLLGLVRGMAAGQELWRRIAAERVIGSGFRLAGAAVLLSIDRLDVSSATVLMTFGPLVGALAYVGSSFKRAADTDASPRLRAITGYSLRIWIGAVSGILLMRIDQSFLVPLAGPRELGLYAVAVAISELPLVVNSAIRDVSFARHSYGFDGPTLTSAARVSTLVSTALALVAAAAAPAAIPILFGDEFRGAVVVTWILLVAVALGTPGSIAGAGLSAIGRPGLRSTSLSVAAAANVVALVVLAPLLGARGAALATLIGNLISSNLNIYFLRRETAVSWTDFYRIGRRDVVRIRSAAKSLTSVGQIKQEAKAP